MVAILNLLNSPLGTLLGGYALWVLLQERMGEYMAAAGDTPGGDSEAAS